MAVSEQGGCAKNRFDLLLSHARFGVTLSHVTCPALEPEVSRTAAMSSMSSAPSCQLGAMHDDEELSEAVRRKSGASGG